ncbi:MAG: glycoside hydrolase family 3 C-terminal domain-containing protein, partial [Christensenellales bacterium]
MEAYKDTTLDPKARAHDLVSRMTVWERASQLRYDAPAVPRLGVPEYNWWNEALHGVARAGTATMFPQAIALAAMFDEDGMERVGDVISTEGRAKYNAASRHEDRDIYKGLTFWSPNINIFRDPRWGRGHETYGEDPYLTARSGVGFVKGVQGKGKYLKAAACAKHLAAHSGPEALRHSFNAEVSLKDLNETYLPAFEALVKEAHVEAVMGAYNRTNGEPCCGSKTLMRDILRGKWGFEGHYVSDCWAIADFHTYHHVTDTAPESAALAIKSGCDVNCGNTYLHILTALQEGLITEDDITTACERLFTTRIKLGLFDEHCEFDEIPYEQNDSPEHHKIAIEAAQKSIVLLKNDGTLPLDMTKYKSIAVIGPNADNRVALIGNYHGTASRYVTLLDAVQMQAGDTRVFYSEGCDKSKDKSESLSAHAWDRMSEAETCCECADLVILAVGLDETMEGEQGDAGNAYYSGDKRDLNLPRQQVELMRRVLNSGKPVIVVNFTGSAVDLRMAQDKAAAVVQAWYPGALGGLAIMDVLTGRVSPSGKLPVTFYNDAADLPDFTDYSMAGRTYRYFTGDVLYPFGYGLTYGSCR